MAIVKTNAELWTYRQAEGMLRLFAPDLDEKSNFVRKSRDPCGTKVSAMRTYNFGRLTQTRQNQSQGKERILGVQCKIC
jgi:hypothetical protein